MSLEANAGPLIGNYYTSPLIALWHFLIYLQKYVTAVEVVSDPARIYICPT